MERVQVGIDPNTGEPTYKKKEGTPDYAPIASVVKDKFEGTSKESEDRNNIIDLLLKDFLKGNILDIRQFDNAYNKYQRKYNSAVFSQEMLNNLFDKFRSVQILLKSNGLTVLSNLPILSGKIGNKPAAGAIDLIAYDSAGKIYIIDLKTSTQDRRAQYKLETDLETEFGTRYSEIKEAIKGGKDRNKTLSETIASTRISDEDKEKLKKVAKANPTEDTIYFYKDQDAKQQNAKKELLRQSTGLVADVVTVFPLLTTKAGKMFTKVEFQKEGKDHSMAVESYDIHEKLGVKNEATYPPNPIDRKAVTPVTAEPMATQSAMDEAEQKLKEIWNSIGNNAGRSALEEGWAESFGYIKETLDVGGENYLAHGMGKPGFGRAIKDLFELFKNGIDPSRSAGQLYVAPLVLSEENKGLAAGIGTAGGTPYTDGAFVLVAKKTSDGIRSLDDIGGILVNSGLTELNPEILTELRKAFPNLVIESYKNAKGLVEQLNKKAEEQTTTSTPTDIEAKKADIEERRKMWEDQYKLKTKEERDEYANPIPNKWTGLYFAPYTPKEQRVGQSSGENYEVIKGVSKEDVNNKIIAKYNAELSALGGTTTEEQPTEKTTEQTIADLRAREQKDLLYAIPNIESYKDASGKLDKSKLSPLELQLYNQIYDKYDKLISPLLKTEPKTGTQTQMDFGELTFNVGDKVKVNTPKDGEGVIKEDRGDKVLLEDGRQVMKKSLTKLTEEVIEENPNQAEIDKLTQEYEATVAKRKTYYNSLRQKVGKVSQDVYLSNLKTAEDKELASLKETYEQALEALGVARSPETQLENISKMNLPESVMNLRESIAKADRIQLSTLEASLKPLSELGIAETILKQQNLTKAEVNDLIKNARARLKGTLAHAELINAMRLRKPLEERVIYYDTEKGTQAGVLMSFDDKGVFVAPYNGEESMSDLQDESKWITFTVGEIPYKLFYAKTTTPVTATPDITQQSDDLINDEEANKSGVDALKNNISNDDFNDQSADDAAADLFDDLNNCVKPVKPK
jgi:hypothetical protein